MTTKRTLKLSRLGLAALAVLLSGAALGQVKDVTYAVTILGSGNALQLPSLGIDAVGRVAGLCIYDEDGQTQDRAWTFDPNLGYHLSDSEHSSINGVSADGALVGSSFGAPTVFDWLGNPTMVFPTTSGCFMAVNLLHDIAGYVFDPTNDWAQTAVLLDRNGDWTWIRSPEIVASAAYGINDNGVAVGFARNILGESRAFYWKDGFNILSGVPGNNYVATGVNNRLQIVGYAVTPENRFVPVSWILAPNRVKEVVIDLPDGFTDGYAQAVSDRGQIVGSMWGNNGETSRAFVTNGDGTVVDLNNVKSANVRMYTLVSADAVNTNGDIAGMAQVRIHPGGPIQTMAYLARPLSMGNTLRAQ